jgi:hypothetical protein
MQLATVPSSDNKIRERPIALPRAHHSTFYPVDIFVSKLLKINKKIILDKNYFFSKKRLITTFLFPHL